MVDNITFTNSQLLSALPSALPSRLNVIQSGVMLPSGFGGTFPNLVEPILQNGSGQFYYVDPEGNPVTLSSAQFTLPPGGFVLAQNEGGQTVTQAFDSDGNYLYWNDSAGSGEPIQNSEIPGQNYYVYSSAPGGVAVDNTSLAPGDFLSVSILNQIFNLLASMIDSVQAVTAAQANRLNFLNAWQQAYTDLMNQVPAFTADNPSFPSFINGANAGTLRDALNSFDQNLTEQMRANSSLVSDDAQAMQSTVNQSNDEVTQQSNMATSIIQQFSTILQSIYSG